MFLLLSIVLAVISAIGAAASMQLLREPKGQIRSGFKVKNSRMIFAVHVLCAFFWWIVLPTFAVKYGLDAAKARRAPKVVPEVEQNEPATCLPGGGPLRSGAEIGIYQ